MKQVWQTTDGEIFENKQAAQKHEDGLFNDWLEKDKPIKVSSFLALMSHEKDGERLSECAEALELI